ncbi:MAG TPA: IclR family transcriptional regulator [Candidatus Scatomorpha merdigallinarum]|nr:IclR family transcriptional regulator [Candidatus Scatomorpha merdigallinarum]
MKTPESSQYILSSLDHALDALGLYFEYEELTAAKAAKALGVSRTAAFRILYTLEAKGYLTRTEEGGYRLGIKLFSLGALAQTRMVLAGLVRPELSRLADETGETAHLATMDGPYHIVFVDKALGRLNLKMDTVLGDRRWAHQTATGKMLLSQKRPEQWEQYAAAARFERPTPNSIGTPEQLYNELRLTRERGWAIDNEESEEGLTCFAVALTDASGAAIAAISCSGPSTRMERNRERTLAALRGASSRLAGIH